MPFINGCAVRDTRLRRRIATALTFSLVMCAAAAHTAAADPAPSPWVARDIGTPAIAGASTFDPVHDAFTLTGAGADIWGVADQFHFTYQQITGDVDIIARVDSVLHTDEWSKAGVMIRSSLSAGAAQAFALVSAQKGVAFQSRAQVNGTSTNIYGEAVAAPRWVRLLRAGTRVTAYSSSDGAAWKTIGSASIALGSSAYVGLAVTSHDATAATIAVVSHTKVTALSLPSPQKDVDIGPTPLAGAAKYSLGTYTVTGSGSDIWGQQDQFNFVYQALSGDVDVSARIAALQGSSSWAKAGVMIRDSLANDSRHALALISTAHGSAFQRRIDPGGFTVSTAGAAIDAPSWIRLVRTGNQFTAYTSLDGVKWTAIGTDSVPMVDTVYVGLAVTSHSDSSSAKATIDHFKLAQAAAAPNQPPVVSLTAPAGGSTFTAPANITVSAQASDPQNRLARVEFYAGTTRIGSLTAAPFSVSWKSVPAGTYALTAVASDLDGASTTSAAVTIHVVTATTTTTPTTVTFQKSADHATLVTYYLLEVFAAGANPSSATPVAAVNLSKPTPDSSGLITVNETTFFNALPRGSYIATVSAVGSGGKGRSQPVSFTR
jgi:regulation of enolase protein 1 (concanavalin A-like superfamily)